MLIFNLLSLSSPAHKKPAGEAGIKGLAHCSSLAKGVYMVASEYNSSIAIYKALPRVVLVL